ncbi:hypothetical protein J1605_012470 [Eschrichtius robustus]|uniref:Uncharacterized protein n=1 Tax=Eschrichtius robustus TaxID=9764 RepID=A0AB34GLB4_ESCRO|nr:hypothetical protein J1605_012470 [Eschrichtius robustus]
MSVSVLSPTRALGGVSGLLQVASLLGLVLLLLKPAQLYLRRQWLLKALQQFPSPPSHWLYGHMQEACGVTEKGAARMLVRDSAYPGSSVSSDPGEDSAEQVPKGPGAARGTEKVEKFPCVCPHWLWGNKVHLMVYDPDYTKVVLGRSAALRAACLVWSCPPSCNAFLTFSNPKFAGTYRFLAPGLLSPVVPLIQSLQPTHTPIGGPGNGLLVLEGQTWFQHRRMLTPAFHYDILKPYMGFTADSVPLMLDKWEELVSLDSHLEVLGHVSLMALDTIMNAPSASRAMSRQTVSSASSPFRKIQSYIQAIRDLSNLSFSRVRNLFYQNDIIYRLTPEGRWSHRACQLTHQHTDEGINLRKAHLQKEGELEKVRSKRHLDFLDILLFARRCREEIQSLLGDGASITWDPLNQMPNTTTCIKETLRLYSPVPVIGRDLSKPITFPDGCSLLAGIPLFLSFYGLHHNPKVWPNPEVFDPSRFAPGSARHSRAFLPFSGGSRNCIGKQFAMNEMKVAMALTLLRFELAPDPPRVPVPIPKVVLKPKNGIHLQLRKLL